MMTADSIIDLYYPAGTPLRDIYLTHCRAVARMAIDIARRHALSLSPALVERAAMLHDIGIFRCDAPSIECHGHEPYIRHGIIGAALLRELGVEEAVARVAERHTGSGLTRDEILTAAMPLPPHDYLPESLLEKLVCYADKFFSKSSVSDPEPKPIDKVRRQMARFGADSLARFEAMHRIFG